MSVPILRCSLEDLAQVYSLKLNEFEPIPLTQLGQSPSGKFDLKNLYIEAQQQIATTANNEGCEFVGCFQFTYIPVNGYIAEAIGLRKTV